MPVGDMTSKLEESYGELLRLFSPREEFAAEYRRRCGSKEKAQQLFTWALYQIEEAASRGNLDYFRKCTALISNLDAAESNETLKEFYKTGKHNEANLVILSCKHNRADILEYLFGKECTLIDDLYFSIGNTRILPDDEDATGHNAFYYAIRSGNTRLIDTLISKWPHDFFKLNFDQLDVILSRVYEELKLKNVFISEEMEIFVEDKLINLRFFSTLPVEGQTKRIRISNMLDRIELVLENIAVLRREYQANAEVVDERFLFIAKFISQNIHILKRQLRSTYNALPWEEIEFILVSFISCHTKIQEMNLFYQATLNKLKILSYLGDFSSALEEHKDLVVSFNFHKLAILPKCNREKTILKIVEGSPQFSGLYDDYQEIRDIYSLEKISNYTKLALLADPNQIEGRLIITRVLQIMGEYLKNTLESPKMSSVTSDLLLLSLPKNTRQIIIDLRNSLSHGYSLTRRTSIEENTDVNFFIGVQNDAKRIDNVITDILHEKKIKIIRHLLERLAYSDSLDEMKLIAEMFSNVKLDGQLTDDFVMSEQNKLEKLIKQLVESVTEATGSELNLISKINKIVSSLKNKSGKIRIDYAMTFKSLRCLCVGLIEKKIDIRVIRTMKFLAKKSLKHFASKIETQNIKDIAEFSVELSRSVASREQTEKAENVRTIAYNIFATIQFGTNDLKWIEELRDKLLNDRLISSSNEELTFNAAKDKYNDQLTKKLAELKTIFSTNALDHMFIDKVPSFKKDKKLQAVIEMLVLDIMSILGISEKHLEKNSLYLDDSVPLLTGKSLRNHLAHDDTLVDVLLPNSTTAVVLNAEKLITEDIVKSRKKVGKLVKDDPAKLREKFNKSINSLSIQAKVYSALENGKIEDLKESIRQGGDIYGRNKELSTALHFAARGPCLVVFKFLIDEKMDCTAKDINGQSVLHVAAAYGRENTVQFLIEGKYIHVADLDTKRRTPLHIAAKNGHRGVVKLLLKNNADASLKDNNGSIPLIYAIQNNHIDVVRLMLENESNVDVYESWGGFTALHVAAESGHLKIVDFLLNKKANVNASNDKGATPLHLASIHGFLDVVNTLMLKGANANARVLDGCSALHYAVESGHEDVSATLLKHGADANAVDKMNLITPLHYAAKDGNLKIIQILLADKANCNNATAVGSTPLHFAAQNSQWQAVEALMDHRANVHLKDKNSATALYYAAEVGCKEIVCLLINNGVEINSKTKDLRLTPLHIASLNGHSDIVELLLVNGANVAACDLEGRTALHAAAQNGNTYIIEKLLSYKSKVDAKNADGMTPLHMAAYGGNEGAVTLLIKNNANVNSRSNEGFAPLNGAIVGGHVNIVNLLIKNKADVKKDGALNSTPLHLAVESGSTEIVEILISHGAYVDITHDGQSLLMLAIKMKSAEIVEVLLKNGASASGDDDKPLQFAVLAGYKDIAKTLIKYKANLHCTTDDGYTLLYLASRAGHKEMVKYLIKVGASLDATSRNRETPLFIAAQQGHAEIVEVLIRNGAGVNVLDIDGETAMHAAAVKGHVDVIDVLWRNNAKIDCKDKLGRSPFELAVSYKHIPVVQKLLEFKQFDLNAKGNDGFTILHIAAQSANVEMVKFLVEKGCSMNAKNYARSKPIHIAAREGFLETVKFFISKGMSINEYGNINQTLLHYAAINNQLEVAKYLLEQGANVNAEDSNEVTPLHLSAYLGHKNVTEILLNHGAILNSIDRINRLKPVEMAKEWNIINLLRSSEKLFEAIKMKDSTQVEKLVATGAVINARNFSDKATPLHYAANTGNHKIVEILLKNGANPNLAGAKGVTPLFYAAKGGHFAIVKSLLAKGAIYNARSDKGKTPFDFSNDTSTNNLLTLIGESFKKVEEDNDEVIKDLNGVKDEGILQAVMGARNAENKTLIVHAEHSNFSNIGDLKGVSQTDISLNLKLALEQMALGNFQSALMFFLHVLQRRKEVFGSNNPATMDIEVYIATIKYKQGEYAKALTAFEDIFRRQKDILGADDKNTLSTRSFMALVLHRQGRDKEALIIYEEVYEKQKDSIGPDHFDSLNTQFEMALVLDSLGRYDEAISLNKMFFEKMKEQKGPNDPTTILAENNLAMVLSKKGSHDESLKLYRDVLKKKKRIFGPDSADTLRTMHNIAGVLFNRNKHSEALNQFQETLNLQRRVLQPNHPDTLDTEYNIANILFIQGKLNSALKLYSEHLEIRKAVYGPKHLSVIDSINKIEIIDSRLKLQSTDASKVLQLMRNSLIAAASEGNATAIQKLLKEGGDVNEKDGEGRTPLHFAASMGHLEVVKLLIKSGGDVSKVTKKGNTPLHTASSKGYHSIIEALLQGVSRDQLAIVDYRTTSSGATALHAAVKFGSIETVKCLLKYGANYEAKDKGGKAPIDYSSGEVAKFLKLAQQLFDGVRDGNAEAIKKLTALQGDEIAAMVKAKDNHGKTLLLIALENNHKLISDELLNMVKKSGKAKGVENV